MANNSGTLSRPSEPSKLAQIIENKINLETAGNLAVNSQIGGASFQNMAEVMEFSKLMAISAEAVPPHCRNNVGVCLGLTIQAIEWRMSPYAVASKSYVVTQKNGDTRISYESQLIHAVIEQRAPIQERLRHKYLGQGGKRQCVVWATAKGETEPREYISPEIERITPKNSPLWTSKPDLQLFYNASRDWARMYFPDVIMGVYSEDELVDGMPGSQAVDQRSVKDLNALAKKLTDQRSQPIKPGDEVNAETVLAARGEFQGPPAEDVDQRRDDSFDGVDEPASDDANQDPPGNAASPTAEELADQARDEAKQTRGRKKQSNLMDTAQNTGN